MYFLFLLSHVGQLNMGIKGPHSGLEVTVPGLYSASSWPDSLKNKQIRSVNTPNGNLLKLEYAVR